MVAASPTRLLPGDSAPSLALSMVLNGPHISEVPFNQPSLITLWNAGCESSVSMIDETVRHEAAHGVRSYAVAVMVRDVKATITAVKGSALLETILAIEQSSTKPSALSRGSVTRNWLEASGHQSIPTSFIVNDRGIVVWMGDSNDVHEVLPKTLDGLWDLEAERTRWLSNVTDKEIFALQLDRDVMDLLAAGHVAEAKLLIARAEREMPELASDKQVNVQKLIIPTCAVDQFNAAIAQYHRCVTLFHDDVEQQLFIAGLMIQRLSSRKDAIKHAAAQLAHMEIAKLSIVTDEQVLPLLRRDLLLAQAYKKLGMEDDCEKSIERAASVIRGGRLPAYISDWAQSEMAKL
ncbi:hypothetical protein [Rhizobium sp. GR12]|uniref:hypothetical protein n=1 Tax=Rhizobium sp. GR12 TaxID=3053925 RepID=UPI002FBE5E62